MPDAEEVAAMLAYEFLRKGNFSSSTGPVVVPNLMQVAAAADVGMDAVHIEEGEFASLAVQSVGFDDGVDNPQVHIYLTQGSKKMMESLPEDIAGVRILAHRMGKISVRPDAAAAATNRGNLFERGRRVCCGSSCGPTSESSSGTLGALAQIGGAPQMYLLSNNHVLAGCNHVPYDQPVLSPSSGDGRPDISAPKEIGRHDKILELTSGNPNFVSCSESDAAIARVTDGNLVTSWQGDARLGYDTPPTIGRMRSGQRVKKIGRTTGLTEGIVEAHVTAPTPITYHAKHFKGVVWFTNVWTIRAARDGEAFALSGDSGSLVVTDDSQQSLGLVFAANPKGDYGWIIPMQTIAQAFGGLTLVAGHGI